MKTKCPQCIGRQQDTQKTCYLRDNGDGFPEALHVHQGDVLVVDGDAAVLGLVEAVQKAHDGGLPET